MTSKLTREQAQQIIDAADAVISALAGTNDEVHKDDTDKMVRLWDDLNDRYAPPEVVRELACMALAAMDSEPADKPFMYGIADPDGNAHIDEFCVSEDLGLVEDAVNELNYDREDGDELNYSVVPLYRHAQPAPVVPEEMTIRDACKFVQDMRLFDDVSVIVMRTWNACRAAMLNGGKS